MEQPLLQQDLASDAGSSDGWLCGAFGNAPCFPALCRSLRDSLETGVVLGPIQLHGCLLSPSRHLPSHPVLPSPCRSAAGNVCGSCHAETSGRNESRRLISQHRLAPSFCVCERPEQRRAMERHERTRRRLPLPLPSPSALLFLSSSPCWCLSPSAEEGVETEGNHLLALVCALQVGQSHFCVSSSTWRSPGAPLQVSKSDFSSLLHGERDGEAQQEGSGGAQRGLGLWLGD